MEQAARVGPGHVVATAARRGPRPLFGLGGGLLSATAQFLVLTLRFAAAMAFPNCTWRYTFALGREHALPAALDR